MSGYPWLMLHGARLGAEGTPNRRFGERFGARRRCGLCLNLHATDRGTSSPMADWSLRLQPR